MRKIALIALAALALASPAIAQDTTIVIDNRGQACNADSRIAEGNRKRAEWKANAIKRDLKAAGKTFKVIRLESGQRNVEFQGEIVALKVC